jgi:hypothetical protein
VVKDEFLWFIGNGVDTTVASSDNTYDRIAATLSVVEGYPGSVGVYRFDSVYDFSSPTLEPDDVSDHYPVHVGLCVENDDD